MVKIASFEARKYHRIHSSGSKIFEIRLGVLMFCVRSSAWSPLQFCSFVGDCIPTMSRHLSPGAQLLRSSRLFSVPPPLPKASLNFEGGSFYRHSETATTPYPAHQAIVTPSSALHRGDWGLKRPLPDKLVSKSTNPTIRVINVDTIEHVTDYESAGDHTRTLEKFTELRLAISRRDIPRAIDIIFDQTSAFESKHDLTAKDPLEMPSETLADYRLRGNKPKRWKFAGPLLATFSHGDFNKFLKQKLKGKRGAFMDFLKPRLHKGYLEYESRQAMEQSRKLDGVDAAKKILEARFYQWLAHLGKDAFAAFLQNSNPSKITFKSEADTFIANHAAQDEAELSAHAAHLSKTFRNTYAQRFEDYAKSWIISERQDKTTASKLNNVIREFLDMPQLDPDKSSSTLESFNIVTREPGTFSTHPSAGLGYLRTNNVFQNHPLLGPQEHKTPIPARVLRPRFLTRSQRTAMLGVAGFVANEPTNVAGQAMTYDQNFSGVAALDITAEGGPKVWVHSKEVLIDPRGKVRLQVGQATSAAVNIRNNTLEAAATGRSTVAGRGNGRGLPFSGAELERYGYGGTFDMKGSAAEEWREKERVRREREKEKKEDGLNRVMNAWKENEQMYKSEGMKSNYPTS